MVPLPALAVKPPIGVLFLAPPIISAIKENIGIFMQLSGNTTRKGSDSQ